MSHESSMSQPRKFLGARWLWLAVRSALIIIVIAVPAFVVLGMMVAVWESQVMSDPRRMQAVLAEAMIDTAEALASEDIRFEQLQQVLEADLAGMVGYQHGSRTQWLHLNVWSKPAVVVQLISPDGALMVEAEHNALALAADADGVLEIGVPLARLDGSLAGTARFRIRAEFDLASALRWTLLVVGDWLLLTIPVALVAATISTAVSVRAARLELKGISTAVNAWAQGDFSVRVPLSRHGELVELSQSLNEMAEALEELVALREQRLLVRERNRLARELHDTVRQQLFGLSLKAASAQASLRHQGTSAAALDGFQELIQSAQSELQRLIDHTAIDPDEAVSLHERLRKLLATIERQHGLRLELEVTSPLSLDAEQCTELYRIVQEAISNVIRHADARQARVSIAATDAGGMLTVEDDGRGFESSQRQPGYGLASMRARAAVLPRGQLHIHARPGQGTRLEVVWQQREAA